MTLPWTVRAVDRWGFLAGVTGLLANVRAVTTALVATVLIALARSGSADTTWMPHPFLIPVYQRATQSLRGSTDSLDRQSRRRSRAIGGESQGGGIGE